jgi:hypothetical protein
MDRVVEERLRCLRGRAVGFGTFLLFGVTASAAFGATQTTPYAPIAVRAPEIQKNGAFGETMVVAGDFNGDGVNDLLVSSSYLGVAGKPNVGRVYAVDGRTRKVLFTVNSPDGQAGGVFGTTIAPLGDINGDGVPDFAVGGADNAEGIGGYDVYTGSGAPCGAPEPNGCNEDQGRVWIFAGTKGGRGAKLLRIIDNPVPQGSPTDPALFGKTMAAIGDVTGKHRHQDLLVSAGNNDQPAGCGEVTPVPDGCRVDEGQVFLLDPLAGKLLRTFNLPAADRVPPGTCLKHCGVFGDGLLSPGDVNGDGVPDIQIDATNEAVYSGLGASCLVPPPNGCNTQQGRLYIFSGKTGELLRRIDDPYPHSGETFGFDQDGQSFSADFNHDGHADIYAGNSQEGPFQGEGFVFDGSTGKLVYALHIPNPQLGRGLQTATVTDYNQDGVPDLYVGDLSTFTVPQEQNGGTFIYDGRNGHLLKALELPTADRQLGQGFANYGPDLGWNVGSPGDLNGDGQPDYAASAPFYDEGSTQDAGRIYFFLSRVPVITGYRITNKRFGAGGAKRSTTFRFSLSRVAPATVRIAIFQGKRKRGTLRRVITHQGAGRVTFSGRLGSTVLRPGNYRATITATDAARDSSKPGTVTFTVL